MPPRPRHNNKDYEKLIKNLEKSGWRSSGGGNRHYSMYCPCEEKHKINIPTTPSSRFTLNRKQREVDKSCWPNDTIQE